MVLVPRKLLRHLAVRLRRQTTVALEDQPTVPLEDRVRALPDEALCSFRAESEKRTWSREAVRRARNIELEIHGWIRPPNGLPSDSLTPNRNEEDRQAAEKEVKAADEEIRRREEKKEEDQITRMADEKLKERQSSLEYLRSQNRLQGRHHRELRLVSEEIHRRDSNAQRERDSRDRARTKIAIRAHFVSWISLAVALTGLAVSVANFFLKAREPDSLTANPNEADRKAAEPSRPAGPPKKPVQ
jgi:hypothetical protein